MKINKGDIVKVTFWDHAQCSDDALLFVVYGKVEGITKKAYKVSCWHYANEVDKAADHNLRHNEDWFLIVKSAIEDIKVLK